MLIDYAERLPLPYSSNFPKARSDNHEKDHMESKSKTTARLIMAANSLGLPTDIPSRSLEALRSADLLIFEEDRAARQALKAAGIHRPYLRYTEHDEQETLDALKQAFQAGQTVVYMSDQGMPTVADPGRALLRIAHAMRVSVSVIPGPSSIVSALAACSFLENSFLYLGFLPREDAERRQTLEHHASSERPLVILEAPYRRQALLQSAKEVIGGERRALLALDISGPDEAFLEGTLTELCAHAPDEKLNFVLVVAGEPHASSRGKTVLGAQKATRPGKPHKPQRQGGQPAKRQEGRTDFQKRKPKRSPR